MEETKMLETIQEIFRDVFELDKLEISIDTCADDIEEWDSLTHIIMLQSIQDEFGVKFSIDEIVTMKNVGDMMKKIGEKING